MRMKMGKYEFELYLTRLIEEAERRAAQEPIYRLSDRWSEDRTRSTHGESPYGGSGELRERRAT